PCVARGAGGMIPVACRTMVASLQGRLASGRRYASAPRSDCKDSPSSLAGVRPIMSVTAEQRCIPGHPCPICGTADLLNSSARFAEGPTPAQSCPDIASFPPWWAAVSLEQRLPGLAVLGAPIHCIAQTVGVVNRPRARDDMSHTMITGLERR